MFFNYDLAEGIKDNGNFMVFDLAQFRFLIPDDLGKRHSLLLRPFPRA